MRRKGPILEALGALFRVKRIAAGLTLLRHAGSLEVHLETSSIMKKLVIVSAVLVATGAHAQSSTPPANNARESNDVICRTVVDTGSRLNRSRMCKTRAEWEIYRREARQNVERSQTRRVERAFDG